MTAKEILLESVKKVRALWEAPVVPPVTAPVTLATYKLKDGTEISISGETVEIGGMVTIGGAQAPSGDYELEDGRKITVDATGAITLIVTPEPITQTDLNAQPEISLEERTKKLEESIAAIEAKVGAPANFATEDQFGSLAVKLRGAEQKITKQDEVIKGLFELVEKLVEEPTEEPKAMSESQKEKFAKRSSIDERHKLIAETLKKNKALA